MQTGFRDYIRIAARDVVNHPRSLGRAVGRAPLEHSASRLWSALPVIDLVELTGPRRTSVDILDASFRGGWSLGIAEQFVIQALIEARAVKSVFEIGTYNGGTTRMIAERLPADGRVVTVDQPTDAFTGTDGDGFSSDTVGLAYRDSAAAGKIEQLRIDSVKLDTTPYRAGFDLVLIDAAHDYVHGISDSRSALDLVAPGGIVLWDDFTPFWHGLVRGVIEAVSARGGLKRLAGTDLAVLVNKV